MSAKADATARMLYQLKPGDRVVVNIAAVEAWIAQYGAYLGLEADDIPRCMGTVLRFPEGYPVHEREGITISCAMVSWGPPNDICWLIGLDELEVQP